MRDKRATERHPFGIAQRIGGICHDRMPSLDEFSTVRCVDLSRAGFAFLADQPPAFEDLIVALGTKDQPIFLMAKIIHTTRVQRDGATVYRVGCEFNGRVSWNEQARRFVSHQGLESAALLLAQAD